MRLMKCRNKLWVNWIWFHAYLYLHLDVNGLCSVLRSWSVRKSSCSQVKLTAVKLFNNLIFRVTESFNVSFSTFTEQLLLSLIKFEICICPLITVPFSSVYFIHNQFETNPQTTTFFHLINIWGSSAVWWEVKTRFWSVRMKCVQQQHLH